MPCSSDTCLLSIHLRPQENGQIRIKSLKVFLVSLLFNGEVCSLAVGRKEMASLSGSLDYI